MRDWPLDLVNHLQARLPVRGHALIWFSPKNRSTGLTETVGLWSGEEHRTFTIDAASREYYGAGDLLDLGNITMTAGVQIQTQEVKLSQVSPEVITLIRTYDTRLAPCEIHLAVYNPLDEALICPPVKVWEGFVEGVNQPRAAMEQQAAVSVTLVSSARGLTIPLASKRSDATLRARSPDDAFRQYADVAGKTEVFWGKVKEKSKAEKQQELKDQLQNGFNGLPGPGLLF